MDVNTEISEDTYLDVVGRCYSTIKDTVDCKTAIKEEVGAELWLERMPVKVKLEEAPVAQVPELIMFKEELFHQITSSVSHLCSQNNEQENSALYESQDTDNGGYQQPSPVESNRICEETYSAHLMKNTCVRVKDLQGSGCVENTISDDKKTSTLENDTLSEEVHACTLCEMSFTKLSFLMNHYAVHERKTNNCTVCDKSFTVLRDLEKHYLSHERKGYHKCDLCHRRFTRKHGLKLHHLSHQGSEQQYKCHICDKEFSLVNSLRRHISIHNLKLLFRCEICDTKFTRMDWFERHNLNHDGKGQYKCEIYDK